MADIYTLPTPENPEGTRVNVGHNPDPTIIGPDDYAAYEHRKPHELNGVPQALLDAEVKYLLPIARGLAEAIGIDCLQEVQYGNVLEQLRERSVFIVLNVLHNQIDAGIANYHGLIIMCKRHVLVRVACKVHISTGRFGISQVHTWHRDVTHKDGGIYMIHGDREGRKPIAHETILPLILDYLESKEKVLTLV